MLVVGQSGARLHITGGANFEMDSLVPQMFDERGIFDTSHAVPDSRRPKSPQRFPNAFRATRLSRMGGAVETMVDCVMESRNVGVNREAGFVPGDIQCDDAATAKTFDQ